MANRSAPALVVREGDRDELERWTRAQTIGAGAARRAWIVLLAGEGMASSRIAEMVGVSLPTVLLWRGRYATKGLAGLGDEPRSGRLRTVDHGAIVSATLRPPPKRLRFIVPLATVQS